MARLIYSDRALRDLERLSNFLIESDPLAAIETFALIEEAVRITTRHPYIGRPVGKHIRGLIISRGRSGYIAKYDVDERENVVRLLAIRHQREVGLLVAF